MNGGGGLKFCYVENGHCEVYGMLRETREKLPLSVSHFLFLLDATASRSGV